MYHWYMNIMGHTQIGQWYTIPWYINIMGHTHSGQWYTIPWYMNIKGHSHSGQHNDTIFLDTWILLWDTV